MSVYDSFLKRFCQCMIASGEEAHETHLSRSWAASLGLSSVDSSLLVFGFSMSAYRFSARLGD